MNNEIAQIVASMVTFLAPFTPYLLVAGKAAGQKWAETVAEKGGEAAWSKAEVLWKTLHSYIGDDAKVKGATFMVSADPEDEAAQTMLAKVLAPYLQENPRLVQDIVHMLGGEHTIQEVLAERRSWVEKVTQEIEGIGTQRIKASDDSIIGEVHQNKR